MTTLASERAKQAEPVARLHPTDIYDFAGWLTTRPGMMKVGSAFDAAPMADAVGEYLKTFPDRFAAPPAVQAEPIPASILVTMYAENPTGDADMIEFAREVERAHGIGAAPPADDEAVRLLREAKDYLDRWEARPSLQLAIDAYLEKVKK